jgi:hypothetical protein
MLLKKLRNVKPSSEVTSWKKGHTMLTAFVSQTNKNTANGEKSGE